ncbi:glycine-rich cell wall structural protein 1.0-like [Iris pallida]|uniref:Glycine-rich cell wall structural protein 1.0-like n=1 Tax=Iris pallida TaxID=29817 RepID=A0AAX6IEK1_IRIPA|nr:glycine-rich cell wall structural protein 1.0-like [Iris pallida]
MASRNTNGEHSPSPPCHGPKRRALPARGALGRQRAARPILRPLRGSSGPREVIDITRRRCLETRAA